MSQPAMGGARWMRQSRLVFPRRSLAYKRVKANKGAAGVADQSIEDFEKTLKKNLYKIWNRMSSGSYLPPQVRTVKIPGQDRDALLGSESNIGWTQ
jgi:retron-type reverse transcriptase